MTHFKFEGNLEGLSARQLEYISSVLEERGFNNEKVIVQAVGKAGDNYAANVKRITVERNDEKFKMIAKVASTAEPLRTMMNTEMAFFNEHTMYTEVLPKFFELQISADVPENERLKYAACYGSLSEPPNEIILLEDLQVSDFIMLDRFKYLSETSVKLVLKNLAILHSLSYALMKYAPETFSAIKSKLRGMWDTLDQLPEAEDFFNQIEKDMVAIVDKKYKKWFKGTVAQIAQHSRKMGQLDKDSKYSVIQQGDAWINNIMFKLKDDIPVECCMIDYQMCKESSPVADLQYMIFNCTDYDSRAKHYFEWIDYYHTELGNCLSNYGLKTIYIYPRDQLDADMRRCGKMTFSVSSFGFSIVLRESEDAAKYKEAMNKGDIEDMLKNSAVSNLDEQTISRFKIRLEDLLKSFLELGYL